MILCDAHVHLDDAKYTDLADVVTRARNVGVRYMLSVGAHMNTWARSISIAEKYEGVRVAIGCHPHEAVEFDVAAETRLRELARSPLVAAVGETGLDYYYEHSPRQTQRDVFLRHLQAAMELKLPVMLHIREAMSDALEILREHPRWTLEGGAVGWGVAHCFSGDESSARAILDLGLCISFAGNVTYPRTAALKQAARFVPADRLLVETDAPWLAPQAERGKRNEPAFARYTLYELAAIRGVPAEELAEQTTANARRIFGF